MKQKEANYQEMVRSVLAHFELHPDAWRDEAPIAARVATLNRINSALDEQSGTQRRRAASLFSVKDSELDQAATQASIIATRLRSFARHVSDPLLLAAADHSDSDFRYGAQEQRIGLMNDILDVVNEHSAQLAPFKITPADATALRESLTRAGALRRKAGDEQNHGAAATARIPQLIDDARTELEALDDDVPALVDDRSFVESYFIARRIRDRRATQSTEAPAS